MGKLYNLARMTTATTGTGTITLGSAVSGFLSFSGSGVSDGDIVTYAIKDGTASEVGRGTYTASGTTLTRSVLKSTNSDSAINLTGSAEVFITPAAEDFLVMSPPQGRLTVASGTPVLTATDTGNTTVYWSPTTGRYLPLYNGNTWGVVDTGGELSQATTDATKSPAAATTDSIYDIFGWDDGGTIRISRGPAWSSDSSRGTGSGTSELERAGGILVNKQAITNGPAAQRGTFLGSVRTNGSSQVDWNIGSAAANGGAASLGIWNMYNRVSAGAMVRDTTDSWSVTSTTLQPTNGSTTNRISFLCGLQEDIVTAHYSQPTFNSATGTYAIAAIGLNSTTVRTGLTAPAGAYQLGNPVAHLVATPDLGWNYLQELQASQTGGAISFYGDVGTGFDEEYQQGMQAQFMM